MISHVAQQTSEFASCRSITLCMLGGSKVCVASFRSTYLRRGPLNGADVFGSDRPCCNPQPSRSCRFEMAVYVPLLTAWI